MAGQRARTGTPLPDVRHMPACTQVAIGIVMRVVAYLGLRFLFTGKSIAERLRE
jgi:hypothetical protein